MSDTRPDRSSLYLILALTVLPFVLFAPETLGKQTWYVTDYQNYYYPYRKATVDLVRAGNLPLWNPYTSGGMPLLGDGQTALFYPPTWLAFIMRPIHALTLATILSYSMAGVGMFLFAPAIRFDRAISFIGALGFMFCGYMTTQLVHPWMQATIAIVPWTFWAFERMLERPSAGRCVGAALIVALQLFAGHPQVPTYNAVALGFYALLIAVPRLVRRDVRNAIAPIALLAIMYIGGALFAAIQLLPLVELASFSPRAAGTSFDMFVSNSLVGADWLLFFFPYGYGSVATSFMQSIADVHYKIVPISWERMAYVGLLPLVLAIVGLCDARRISKSGEENRFWPIVAVLVSMLMLATIESLPPIAKLVYHIPVLGQYRANARTLGVVAFAINVLAMFGAARITSRGRRSDPLAIVVGACVLSAIGIVLVLARNGTFQGHDDRTRLLWQVALKFPNLNAIAPLILAILTFAVLVIPLRRAATKLALFAIVIAIDLGALARTYNAPTPMADYDSGTPGAVTFLKSDPEPFRVAIFPVSDLRPPALARGALVISWTMAYGIEDINSCNSLQPRRLVDWLVSTKHPDVLYAMLSSNRLLSPYDRALIPLDVKYAIRQKELPWQAPAPWKKVYEDEFCEILLNPHKIARGFFAEFVKPVDKSFDVLREAKSASFDPLKIALIEGDVKPDDVRPLWSGPPGGELSRIQYSANQQTWRTKTSSPKLLVLSEMFFPGWRASYRKAGSSDAWQSLPIYRTNYLFRGIPVPAGENEVRLVYRPMSVIIGASVTLLTALVMIVAIVWDRRRGKRNEAA